MRRACYLAVQLVGIFVPRLAAVHVADQGFEGRGDYACFPLRVHDELDCGIVQNERVILVAASAEGIDIPLRAEGVIVCDEDDETLFSASDHRRLP